MGEPVLGCYGNQLLYPLAEACVVSEERKQPGAQRQAHGQSRRVSQAPRLGDCCVALSQRLVRKAATEKGNSYLLPCYQPRVAPGLIAQRAVGNRIIKRKNLLQVRPGRSKLANEHQVSTGALMAQNKPGGIIALAAQAQQILVQALRQIEFATVPVMARQPIRNLKVFGGEAELLPQLSCPGIGLAHFRRRLTLDEAQCRAQCAPKLEFFLLMR